MKLKLPTIPTCFLAPGTRVSGVMCHGNKTENVSCSMLAYVFGM